MSLPFVSEDMMRKLCNKDIFLNVFVITETLEKSAQEHVAVDLLDRFQEQIAETVHARVTQPFAFHARRVTRRFVKQRNKNK